MDKGVECFCHLFKLLGVVILCCFVHLRGLDGGHVGLKLLIYALVNVVKGSLEVGNSRVKFSS